MDDKNTGNKYLVTFNDLHMHPDFEIHLKTVWYDNGGSCTNFYCTTQKQE